MPKSAEDKRAAEKAAISRFESVVRPPDDYEYNFTEGWRNLANYVANVSDTSDAPDVVNTNYILRTQNALVSTIYPRDPSAVLTPGDWIPAIEDPELAAQMANDPTMQMAQFQTYPQSWTNYVKAQEIIVNKQLDQMCAKQVVCGAIQDALTYPMSCLKLRWVEDGQRDPLGRFRKSARNQRIARYSALYAMYQDGVLEADTSEYAELYQLNNALRLEEMDALNADLLLNPTVDEQDLLGEVVGLDPRIERMAELQDAKNLIDPDDLVPTMYFQGYVLENVALTDMRVDWRINRPEDLMHAEWMAQRVWMYPADIQAGWNLTDDELDEMLDSIGYNLLSTPLVDDVNKQYERDGGSVLDTHDVESTTRGNTVAVWEYWCRITGTVYRWVAGTDRFLDQVPVVKGPGQFFPYHFMTFNRATNELFAKSDAELLRPLQEELNGNRTHDNEAKRSSYPKYLCSSKLINRSLRDDIRFAPPYSIIPTNKADDIRNSLFELTPNAYNPALYDGTRARNDFDTTAGMSASGLGGAQSGVTATAESIANQSLGVQADRRRDIVVDVLRSIITSMVQINAQRLSEENAKQLAGPGTVWSAEDLDREQVLSNFLIDIQAAPNSEQERVSARQELLEEAQIITQLGLPVNRIQLLRDLVSLRKRPHEAMRYVDLAAIMAPPPQPAGANNNGTPAQQGDRGGEGGRPSNEERDDRGATPPESVPNRPQI